MLVRLLPRITTCEHHNEPLSVLQRNFFPTDSLAAKD